MKQFRTFLFSRFLRTNSTNKIPEMAKKYYIAGLRPVIREVYATRNNFYAMEWETGEFKLDMRYNHEILFDPSGDSEEVSKKEFDEYVTKMRTEDGLPQTPY